MAEVRPKLRRVVTFTKNNHRWSRTFDEDDLRKEEECKSNDDKKNETDKKGNFDNPPQIIPFKRSQTIN